MIAVAAAIVAGAAAPAPSTRAGDPVSKTIRVLFLGDRGHHMPAERA